jgi:hypothetical protein
MVDIRSIMAWTLFLIVGMSASACGGYKWEGTWEGSYNFKGGDQTIAKTLSRVKLDLKPGGKVAITHLSMPQEGTYTKSGRTVTLNITDALGARLPAPVTFVLEAQDNNTAILRNPEHPDLEPLTLRRVQPTP